MSSRGQFVYDVADPILAFIVSKAKDVISNENKKNLIRRYLIILAISGLNPFFSILVRSEYQAIILLEKTIVEMLGYPEEYIPLTDRMGKLAKLYNKFGGPL